MKRPVLIHGALLSAALVAAYFTWTRDQTGAEDEVQIVSLRGNLDRVIYSSDDRTVEIERRKDDHGAYHWLRVETLEIPPAPVPKLAPPMPPPRPEDRKAEPKEAEPKKAEPKKAEPKKAEPKKAEPKKAEPRKAEPRKAEPRKAEPRKAEPRKAEPRKAEPKKAESLTRDPKADPDKKAEPKKTEPKLETRAEPKLETKLTPQVMPKPLPPGLLPPKPLAKVRKVQEFKGNKSVEELMKGLASLSAVRSLGIVDGEKLKAFGLENPKKTLTLVSGSSPRVFYVGGNTFGNMDTYLQSKEDRRVFVVRPRLLQDFLYAEFRLIDRSLHSFENNEVERAVITTADGKKRTLVQQNRRDPAGAGWADEATPQQRKEIFRNWMGKLLGLRVLEYASTDKKVEGLKPVLTAEYGTTSKSIGGFLRLYKRDGLAPKPAGSPDESSGDYYATTENTRTMVKLNRPSGDEVARDLANIMRE